MTTLALPDCADARPQRSPTRDCGADNSSCGDGRILVRARRCIAGGDRVARAISRSHAGEPGDDLPGGRICARAGGVQRARAASAARAHAARVHHRDCAADRAVHRGHQDARADRRLALERAAAARDHLHGGDHPRSRRRGDDHPRLRLAAGAGDRRGAGADRPGARLRCAAAQRAGSRQPAIRSHRRGRSQRWHRVPVRVVRPGRDGAARPRMDGLALAHRRPVVGYGRRTRHRLPGGHCVGARRARLARLASRRGDLR